MPSLSQVLTETYLPAVGAAKSWETAKSIAGAQFDALAEERKALDQLSLRRQQYADNIRTREGSQDAFLFQAMSAQASTAAPTPGKGAGKPTDEYTAAMGALNGLPTGAVFRAGGTQEAVVKNALKSAKTEEQFAKAKAAAAAKGYTAPMIAPAGLKSEKVLREKAQAGDAKAQAEYIQTVGSTQALIDLADNLGPRGFQGGIKARSFFEGLTDAQQELARVYASALLDDGVATAEEVGADRLAEARKLHESIAAKGAYRLQDKAAFDKGYLDLLKQEAEKRGAVGKEEQFLAGKTRETLAAELFTGSQAERERAQMEASVPAHLRALQPDIDALVDAYPDGTDVNAYLVKGLNSKSLAGLAAARKMSAAGARFTDIQAELGKLGDADAKSALAAFAAGEFLGAAKSALPPGTTPERRAAIQAQDERAAEAALTEQQDKLTQRLAALDRRVRESRLAERVAQLRESQEGVAGAQAPILTPSSRDLAADALAAEEAAARAGAVSAVEADRAEVERIAAARDLARIERDRRMDTGAGSYDPALNLPAPVPPRLDPNRGDITAGDEDRVERARQASEYEQGRMETALRQYREVGDPRTAAVVRQALMQGLTPAQAVGPGRAELRPEPFEMAGAPAAPAAPVEEVAPVKILRRVWNPDTQTFDLVEVK